MIKNGIVLMLAVLTLWHTEPGQCQNSSTLLLQQSPPNGGNLNHNTGTHQFKLNSKVTLSAVPRPGYKFVYWLGDVSDSTSASTTAYLDSPKLIIAVYEREENPFEFSGDEKGSLNSMESATSRAYRSAADYSRQGGGGGGGKRQKNTPGLYSYPAESESVPEPATMVLYALGSLFLACQKKRDQA